LNGTILVLVVFASSGSAPKATASQSVTSIVSSFAPQTELISC